jgi:tetratricopeptide (TPR) repeat protein
MLAGMAAGLAILVIAALALLGVYQGVQERTRLNRAAAVEHYQKGLEQLALQNYELARAEFELAVQLDANNRDAATKLAEVNALISSQPTATSALRLQTVVLLYNEARESYNRSDWEGVISKLEQVRTLDPEYERDTIVSLMVEAYVNAGLRLIEGNRMEEAIRYFDRALELQPASEEAREQKRWASLYLAGQGYWGADWLGAIESFSVLYQLKPDYKDTRQRLHDAHVAYADTLYEGGDWCAARDHYDSAIAMMPSDALTVKREEAAQNCAVAPGPVGTPPPSGTFVGRLLKVEDVGRSEAMMIRGYVLDVAGNPLSGVQVGLSAWDWSAAPAMTSAEGIFAFDGLANPVTYTVTLVDLPHVPLPVQADWSKLVWVEFRPQP